MRRANPAPGSYTIQELIDRLPQVGHGLSMSAWDNLRRFLKAECPCPRCEAAREAVPER